MAETSHLLEPRLQSRLRLGGRPLLAAVILSAALTGLAQAPASATVTGVSGGGFGYYTSASLFDGPPDVDGPAPSVTLPQGGSGQLVASAPSGIAQHGPAVFFESGPITVTTEGSTGSSGYSASSVSIEGIPDQPGPFRYDSIQTSCTSSEAGTTASTHIAGGFFETRYSMFSQEPIATAPIPQDAAPNTEFSGVIDHVGDRWRAVVNEQIVTSDSITVNAMHLYMLGETARGEIIVGQSRCGVAATSPNQAPVATPWDEYQVEQGQLIVDAPGVLSNDTDPDGDPLTAQMKNDPAQMTQIDPIPEGTTDGNIPLPPPTVSYPANGTIDLRPDGSFTYTPNAGFSGQDSFTYVVRDARGATASDTAYINVLNPSGDVGPPNNHFVNAQSISGASGSVVGSNVDATEEPGEPAIPNMGYNGPSIWYRWTAPADVKATFDTCEANFMTALSVYRGEAIDTLYEVTSDVLTERCAALPGRRVTFNARAGSEYHISIEGTEPVAQWGTMGTTNLTWSSVGITFEPNDDFADAQPISGTSGSVLGSNVDASGEPGEPDHTPDVVQASYSIWYAWTAPADGDFFFSTCPSYNDLYGRSLDTTLNAYTGDAVNALSPLGYDDDSCQYSSPVSTTGSSLSLSATAGTVYYIAVDGSSRVTANGDPETGRVVLDWQQYDDFNPLATDDTYGTVEGTPLAVAAPGILENDFDPTSDALSVGSAGNPPGGSVTLSSDGSFTYTPDVGFNGPDSFTYTLTDVNGHSDTGRVFIDVAPISPVAVDDSYTTTAGYDGGPGTPVSVDAPGVLGNDSDPQGDPLSAGSASDPANGSVALEADGSFTYAPDDGFIGDDTFTYVVSDGNGNSDVGTVTVVVNPPPNRAPVAVDDAYTVVEDGVLEVDAPGVLANDTDADFNTLFITRTTGSGAGAIQLTDHGVVRRSSNGALTYTPNPDFSGTDSFDYRANDGSGGFDDATVTFTVTAVPDAPVAGDDAYTIPAGTALTVDAPGVLGNDADVDGDAVSAGSASDPARGDVTLNADGSFTYTPDGGFNGTDTFTYTVSDGGLGSEPATVTITVTPPPDLGRPTLAVSDLWVYGELDSPGAFTVTRSGDLTGTATVKVKTSGGTATAEADYVPVPLTTLSFAPGETAQDVTLVHQNDNAPEPNETVNVVLSAATGAVIADASGTATIRDDDGFVAVSVDDVSVTEGDSGTAAATFTVTRRMNPDATVPSSVKYRTGTGTASASDFTPVPLTVLNFAPGETSKTVTVDVTGDTVAENNERFTLLLSGPVGAVVSDAAGTATIVDDEGTISPGPATFLSIRDTQAGERTGGSGVFFHEVTRSGDVSGSSAVKIKTSGGTATVGSDYSPIEATLTFGPGEAAKSFPVTFVTDALPEVDETFKVVLSAPTGAVISDASGTVTIRDDDPRAYLSVNNITFVERNEGMTTATFTVTRSGNTIGPATVRYKTGSGSATAGTDYTSVPLTTVGFGPGETTKSVSVDVTGETAVERNETFTLVMSAPTGATISDAGGLATIVNDD